MIGNKLGPDEAYRFAKGEEVISSTGQRLAYPTAGLSGGFGSRRKPRVGADDSRIEYGPAEN